MSWQSTAGARMLLPPAAGLISAHHAWWGPASRRQSEPSRHPFPALDFPTLNPSPAAIALPALHLPAFQLATCVSSPRPPPPCLLPFLLASNTLCDVSTNGCPSAGTVAQRLAPVSAWPAADAGAGAAAHARGRRSAARAHLAVGLDQQGSQPEAPSQRSCHRVFLQACRAQLPLS